MRLTRRQTVQALAAGIAATVAPLTAKAETEEELVAIGIDIETEYMAAIKARPYEPDAVPERVHRWQDRWSAQRVLVMVTASDLHGAWECQRAAESRGGKLTFAYIKDPPTELPTGSRRFGGLFTVPYLADEQELRRLIGKHRPDDFDGPMCGWVPGYES